jgi:phosphatidylinositol N-acetylglucosaminyltransferase subunit H
LFPCMQHIRPLQDHPQFSVRSDKGYREYRVENWRLARDGSGRVIKSYGWTWFDLFVPVLLAVVWPKVRLPVLVRGCSSFAQSSLDT